MVSGVDLIFQAYPKDVAGMIMEYYVTAKKNKTRRLLKKVHKQLLTWERHVVVSRQRVNIGWTPYTRRYEIVDEFDRFIKYEIYHGQDPIYESRSILVYNESIRTFIGGIYHIQRRIDQEIKRSKANRERSLKIQRSMIK